MRRPGARQERQDCARSATAKIWYSSPFYRSPGVPMKNIVRRSAYKGDLRRGLASESALAGLATMVLSGNAWRNQRTVSFSQRSQGRAQRARSITPGLYSNSFSSLRPLRPSLRSLRGSSAAQAFTGPQRLPGPFFIALSLTRAPVISRLLAQSWRSWRAPITTGAGTRPISQP
jgi:hypothetical protein